MKNKQSIETMKIELQQLKSCETDIGFHKRLMQYFLPTLKKQFSGFCEHLQKGIHENKPISIANQELTDAFIEVWQVARRSGASQLLKKEIAQLLKIIRRPHLNIGQKLLERIYYPLEELHTEHVALPREFPFSPSAIKIVKLQEKWMNIVENNPFYFFYSKSEFSKHVFGKKTTSSKLKQSMKKIFKNFHQNSSCASLRDRKIVHLPFYVAYERHRFSFAPSAKKLLQQNRKQNLLSEKDYSAPAIWLHLVTLENCWKYHEGSEQIVLAPKKLGGAVNDIGIQALSFNNQYFVIREATGIRQITDGKFASPFFNRLRLQGYVERLWNDALIWSCSTKEKEASKHVTHNTDLRVKDRETAQGFMSKWWENNKQFWGLNRASQGRAVEALQKAIKETKVHLIDKYEPYTFKKWAKQIDPRPKNSKTRRKG